MSKIITIPSSLSEIENTINLVDGFIIGIKDLCVNTNYKISDLNFLNNLKDKDIFISMNKNFDNKDLLKVKDILIDLNNYNIKGVLFYDIGLLNIYKSLDLNYDLVWSQEHLVTNYNTINYWNSIGVKYAHLSNDITEEEMVTISKNCKSKLLINLFGYTSMFVSKRHIVKNYLEHFNLKDDSKMNFIEKENNVYPIVDDNIATQVYSSKILNGIKSYININPEYVILNSFNIDKDKFIDVIKLFKSVNKDNVEEYNNKINNMFENVDDGFLNTKTIYKVKKNDK